MRVDLVVLTIVALGLGLGCRKEETAKQPNPPPATIATTNSSLIARLHFIGSEQLLATTNAQARLKAISALPETAALGEDALAKLATAPFRFLQSKQKLPAGAGDQSALLRPLLDDLVHNESYLELRNLTNPVPELLLAVHLGNDRADLWRTNLAAVLTAWTGLPTSEFQTEGFAGWELKKHDLPNLVRFIRAGDWVVFGWGQNEILGQPAMLQQIIAQGRPVAAPQDYWLNAWADWQTLFAHAPVPAPASLPQMKLKLGWKAENIRSEMVLQFAASLGLALPDWNVPTNLIRAPLTSFTAARGVAPWLKQSGIFEELKMDPLPDQLFAWAVFNVPFENYLAAPVAGGTNFLQQFGSQLISLENPRIQSLHLGGLGWDEAHTNLIWTGLPPVVAPSLTFRTETNGDFALLSVSPVPMLQKSPPPGLFQGLITHKNVIYYDWERTGEHIGQWRNLIALYNIACHKPFGSPEAPSQKWLEALTTRLGNGVTEVTVPAPNELTLVRNSFVGLSALELALFAQWEGAPGFPLDAAYPQPQPPQTQTNQTPPVQPPTGSSAPTNPPATPGAN